MVKRRKKERERKDLVEFTKETDTRRNKNDEVLKRIKESGKE